MRGNESSLLSGRLLASSAFWSLGAQAIPAIVGVITIPFIIRGVSVDRFGILTLAWMVIGYFGLLDLGLGRAVTKLAAELLVSADRARFDRVVWTAWYLMLALGLAGALILAAIAPWLVQTAIKVPRELQHETVQVFYLLALAMPIVVLTTGLRGVLEAAQHFKLTSLIKIPMGVLTFGTPLLVLFFTTNLAAIVLALIVVRLLGAIAYAIMCHQVVHISVVPPPIDATSARTLLGLGAWMTVSNVVSPLLVGVDRFFVGAFLSVAAVAYYATPFEAVTRLLIIPSAVAAVLFPAFSTASVIDPEKMVRLFRTGISTVFLTMYPIVLIVILFAPELLTLWLGRSFAAESSEALRWLALGVLMNSVAALPFAFLQGIGRSETTAKIHLIEAPIYLVVMIWLIREYGIAGAAVAWCFRTTMDLVFLYFFANRNLRTATATWLGDVTTVAALVGVLGVGVWLRAPLPRMVLTVVLLIPFSVMMWRRIVATGHSLRRVPSGLG